MIIWYANNVPNQFRRTDWIPKSLSGLTKSFFDTYLFCFLA